MFFSIAKNRVYLNTQIVFNPPIMNLKNPFQRGVYKIVYREQGLLHVESMYGYTYTFRNGFVAKSGFDIYFKHGYYLGSRQLSLNPLEEFYVKDELNKGYSASLPSNVTAGDFIWFMDKPTELIPNTIQLA
jgi:hypothetical protein